MRALLLDLFRQWGMPLSIRTDNGLPFGVPTRDVVPIMSLWLAAWGILPILNRPRRPQDNAKVERNQGTLSRWAEVHKCQSLEQMQAHLDEASAMQRDYCPVSRLGKTPRSEVFKDLYTPTRPFDQAIFDEQRAYDYLAQAIYPKKVSVGGTTTVYNKPFQVGAQHKGKIVFVKFDPKNVAWLFFDQLGNLLKTIPDNRFSRENLFNLNICQ
ncbi:MAG: transposase [Saprospiraceae bacterium]|nr:transposase [Saprospiraceae bacterium]